MSRRSPSGLRTLHAVRLLGFADTTAIADRAGVTIDEAQGLLDHAEHRDWIQRSAFADLQGWSLTDSGRAENERQLAHERAEADPDDTITAVHADFLPLNALLLRACTDWQLRPTAGDRLAPNDHTDAGWDSGVLSELGSLNGALTRLVARLREVLARFDGYDARFDAALRRARAGDGDWVDKTNIDSCHRVWFQLHEDLVATLGIDRGR